MNWIDRQTTDMTCDVRMLSPLAFFATVCV